MFTSIVIALKIVILSSASLNSSALSESEVKAAENVIHGVIDSRQRLVSGVCRIHGKNRKSRADSKSSDQGRTEDVECFCAFDFARGLYRFDRNVARRDGVEQGGKFIRTPSHAFELLGKVPELARSAVITRTRPGNSGNGIVAPFDIRIIGLFNLVGAYWERSLDENLKSLSADNFIEFAAESDNVFRLTWKRGNDRLTRYSLWIDTEKGYSWIRWKSTYDANSALIDILAETGWDEKNGVWVPISMHLKDQQTSIGTTEADWSIEWESVNEPVDSKYFDPQDLAPGTEVAMYSDEVGEKPIYLGLVGSAPVKPREVVVSRWRRFCLILTILVVLILLSLIVVRRYRAGANATLAAICLCQIGW